MATFDNVKRLCIFHPAVIRLFASGVRPGIVAKIVVVCALFVTGLGHDVSAADRQVAAALAGDRAALRQVAKRIVDGGARARAAELRPRLRSEAFRGSGSAATAYGVLLQFGIGGAARPDEAVQWYLRAARLGERSGARRAAIALALGWGVRRDEPAARRLLLKLEPGMRARIMVEIGEALLSPGREEPPVAARWLADAAALGTPVAVRATKIYERITTSNDGSSRRIVDWLRAAEPAGGAEVSLALAQRLAASEDAAERVEAARLFLRSSQSGEPKATAALLATLGDEADIPGSPVFAFVREQADAGSSMARFVLGETYSIRSAIDSDAKEKARYYLMIAARDGVAEAQYKIGMLELAEGSGVLGQAYLSLAAEAGNVLAMQAVTRIGSVSVKDARRVINASEDIVP